MNAHRMSAGRHLLLLLTLAVSACSYLPKASEVKLGGKLAGANENPPVASSGSGTVEATLNKETNQLRWRVVYSGLSGPATAAHFHGPAPSGQNAGVVLGFKGSVESPIEGEATVTAAQAADVMAGRWYVNVHSKANPGGEIRAQVVPNP